MVLQNLSKQQQQPVQRERPFNPTCALIIGLVWFGLGLVWFHWFGIIYQSKNSSSLFNVSGHFIQSVRWSPPGQGRMMQSSQGNREQKMRKARKLGRWQEMQIFPHMLFSILRVSNKEKFVLNVEIFLSLGLDLGTLLLPKCVAC